MTIRRTFLGALGGVAVAALLATGAVAQEVTLKLHQFLPAQANVPKLILDVWANNIEKIVAAVSKWTASHRCSWAVHHPS